MKALFLSYLLLGFSRLLLGVEAASAATITIPLNRDPAAALLSPVESLVLTLLRWAIPLSTQQQRVRRGLLGNVLSGVGSTVGSLLDTVGNVVGNLIGDLGFGGEVLQPHGGIGTVEWYGTLSFGTPSQSVAVNFDTGSADLWMFGPTCSTCSLSNHSFFDPTKSSTSKSLSASWNITYADGSFASGPLYSDNADNTADNGGASIVSPALQMAVVNVAKGFTQFKPSGLIGLGQKGLTSSQLGPHLGLLESLVQRNQIAQPLMSVRLVKDSPSLALFTEQTGAGEVVLGGIQSQWIVGGQAALSWAAVTSSNYWGVPLSGVKVGGTTISPSSADYSTQRVIIDTGTTLILTSDSLAASIHALIPGSAFNPAGYWTIPCLSFYPASPNVFFNIAGSTFGIPIEYIAWKVDSSGSGSQCISGIQGGVPSFTVLGGMFIKFHYVVFEYTTSGLLVGVGNRTDELPIL